MSAATLQQKINQRKEQFLRNLKRHGVFLEYCPKRGYIYSIVQSIVGNITRVIVALKNGLIQVLSMERTEETAA